MTVDLADDRSVSQHRPPPPGNRAQILPPMDWNEIKARVQFMFESFLGQVAMAFGGINILGWKPFEFLSEWGQARIDEANENYLIATGAKQAADDAGATANTAMQEINAIKARLFAGSGDYFSDNLDYSEASALPSPYTLHPSGSGSGVYAPNGNSELEHKATGFLARTTMYTRDDYEVTSGKVGAAMIITQKASAQGPTTFLGFRDSSGNGIVLASSLTRIAAKSLTAMVPGSDLASEVVVTTAKGNTFEIYYGAKVGGADYPQAVYIKQDGNVVWFVNDCGIALGTSLFPVIGGSAVGSGFTQLVPARMGSYTIFDSDFAVA